MWKIRCFFFLIPEHNSDLYDILFGFFLLPEFCLMFIKSFSMLMTYLKTSVMALMIV